MSKIFLILSFVYVVSVVIYASMQPIDSLINTQWIWGVIGLVPFAFCGLIAIPAIILLLLSMVFDS